MYKIGYYRIFLIASVISLSVSYAGVWFRLINDPIERTGSDFIAFYTAGRMAQEKGASRVYDIALQRQIEEEQVGFMLAPEQVLQYNHMPFLIPVLRRIVTTDYVGSFARWALLMALFQAAAMILLGRMLKRAGIKPSSARIAMVGGMLFLPAFFSLMNGQDTGILLLGAAIWTYGLLTDSEWIAGLGLSLTVVRPHIALVLATPMLFKHTKVFLAFAAGSGALAIFSFALLGLQGAQQFIHVILVSAGGDWYGIKQNVMFNLIGLAMRIFPHLDANTIRTAGWILYGASIAALTNAWRRSGKQIDALIGLTVSLAVLIVPHLHFHDLALMIVPIFILVRCAPTGRFTEPHAAILPFGISFLLLASNITPLLQFTVPYLVLSWFIARFWSILFTFERQAIGR
jgi:hypothetical protein